MQAAEALLMASPEVVILVSVVDLYCDNSDGLETQLLLNLKLLEC